MSTSFLLTGFLSLSLAIRNSVQTVESWHQKITTEGRIPQPTESLLKFPRPRTEVMRATNNRASPATINKASRVRRANSKPITSRDHRWDTITNSKATTKASIPAATTSGLKANTRRVNMLKANTASILLRGIMGTGVPVERRAVSSVAWLSVQHAVAVWTAYFVNGRQTIIQQDALVSLGFTTIIGPMQNLCFSQYRDRHAHHTGDPI